MYCTILLFNQRRHSVSELHYLGKNEGLEGSKTSAREHPSISGGRRGDLEAPHKYSLVVTNCWYESLIVRSVTLSRLVIRENE